MRRLLPTTIAALVSIFMTFEAGAQVEITFPLGEHYRVGKFFPVRVNAKDDKAAHVAPAGALPVEIAAASRALDTVVPLLAVGKIHQAGWSLKPLGDDDRLVGATTPDAALTTELFPGRRVVNVTLDLSNPLPGPAMAWGALDAVLLDPTAAARVTEGQLAALLAGGTIVAVRTSTRPDGNGPWQLRGQWWVAQLDTPPARVVQPDRYATFANQRPGWPAGVRHTLLLGLAAFSLAALAVTLWRSRRAWIACVLLSVAATAALTLWWWRQPTAMRSVTVEHFAAGVDRWTHYTAVAEGRFRHPIANTDNAVWPILWSTGHARDIGLRLECNADGLPIEFAGRMRRGQSVAFLARSYEPPATRAPAPATSPSAPPR